MGKVFGIDISTWQQGYPYNAANAEGVKFAIIRAGFSRTKDAQFENHYANAKRLGWGVGAYWYMYATSVEAAKQEAYAFLAAVAGKQFEYPLYLDMEDASIRGLGRAKLDEMVRAFASIIEGAGYYFGVYSNMDWYRNVISGSTLNAKYDWWIAYWAGSAPTGLNYGLWQFGGETNYQRNNRVAGVITDQNWAVKDYPSMIKSAGLNGFAKSGGITPSAPVNTKSVNELAQEVLAGKWGNGDARRNSLTAAGYDYAAVQARVNELANGGSTPVQSVDAVYTVQSGDTLSKIASKYNTTYQALAGYNNISNPNIIFVGQQIRIPNGTVVSTPTPSVKTYTVQNGDTLSNIAAKYGTTYQKIASDNGISNPNLIYPGQVLKIK